MLNAKLHIDKHFQVGETDKRLFGSFVEHLGRAVYGGVYQPGNALSDARGFRRDTLALVRELNVPVVRYPVGNFVSGYRWEDGVGPREARPVRPDPAWYTLEDNQIGVNEFADWCEAAGAELMMAVNLGTRGPEDARNLLEYCNFPSGTYYSDLRAAHGYPKPHRIKLWCLGNEMDGPWQMGHKTAHEYGRAAAETGRLMKMLDPSVACVACGSSFYDIPTFAHWEAAVLEEAYDQVDYLSLHQYFNNKSGDTKEFLASNHMAERMIREAAAVCDHIKSKKRSQKQIDLSFDEWNVWYHSNESDRQAERWVKAPPLLEDTYNVEDALVAGSMLITLLRHCDRVKIACLAQLVNVIAPIMTSDTGAWRQTIFYPFQYMSAHGRGTVLHTVTDSPCYPTERYGDVPCLDAVFVRGGEGERLTLFAVNKSLDEDMTVTCDLRQFEGYRVEEHIVFTHVDLKAVNTEARPDNAVPRAADGATVSGGIFNAVLGKHSWNMVRLSK